MKKLAGYVLGCIACAVIIGIVAGTIIARDARIPARDCSVEARLKVYEELGSNAGTAYAEECRFEEITRK